MDSKDFYKKIDTFFKEAPGSITDKFKLDSSDLINAVKNQDQKEVARVLNAWVDPNKRDGLDRIALPYAVDSNDPVIVGMLLRKKANPNVRTLNGETPLYKAVFWENKLIINLLIIAGADVNFANDDGKTPLQMANENGFDTISEILKSEKEAKHQKAIEKDKATHEKLKAKANSVRDAKAKQEEMKEKLEAESKQKSVLKKYPNADANPMIALLSAIKNKDNDAVFAFSEKIEDWDAADNDSSPLLESMKLGHEKLVIFFIKNSANPLIDLGDYHTPLHTAIKSNLYHVVEFIVENFPTADALNNPKQILSPLFLSYKDLKMVNLLLKGGADPLFGGTEGTPFVLKAIEKGSIGTLPILEKYNFNLNQIIDGKSIIEWAITFKKADWVNGLVEENADIKTKNKDGETPLEFAKRLGVDEVLKILE